MKRQPGIEIKSDMKIHLEIEYTSGADRLTKRLSLGSYVEEVMPDGCILIQVPVYRGYNYPLPRDEPILMYLLFKSRMFSMTVRFMERVQRDGLLFAKMRGCSAAKPDQRRSCYRLPCDLPVMVERVPARRSKNNHPLLYVPPLECQMFDFSDGGMLFVANETLEIGEKTILAFGIGTDEVIAAEVLRCELIERADVEPAGTTATAVSKTDGATTENTEVKIYRHKIAVKFTHKCKKQKDRFYKYIVMQQREIIKRQKKQNALFVNL